MANTIDLRTYVLLERSFVRRLQRSWAKQSAPTYAKITQACLDHKWDEARRFVSDLDMAEVGTENREWITYMLLSCAVFGASVVAKRKPSFVGVGTFDTFLKQTTDNMLQYLEYAGTSQVQDDALHLIAKDEAQAKALKFDASEPRDEKGRWRAAAGLPAGVWTAGKNRQVDTPEFKAWFKDSKVVDEQGRPLVVFHGTPSKGSESNNYFVREEQADVQYPLVDEFNTKGGGVTDSGWLGQGSYFTPDPDYAHEFGDRIMPVFLSLQKPFVVEDDASNGYENHLRFLQSLQGMKGLPESLKLDLSMPTPKDVGEDYRTGKPYHIVYEMVEGRDINGKKSMMLLSRSDDQPAGTGAVESKGSTAEAAIFAYRYKDVYNTFVMHTITKGIGATGFRELLEANGYDGVMEREPGDPIPKELVAFHPTQIKSALGNSGAFDPKDPRITKFDEAKHPRHPKGTAEGGEFEPREGFRPMTSGEAAKHTHLVVPPAWKHVQVAVDPKAELQVVGVDVKGRTQYLYNAAHAERVAAEKFARVKDFAKALPDLRTAILKDLTSTDPEIRDAASELYLIDKSGFRIGSNSETKGDVKAYGVTTLLGKHVRVLDGDRVSFNFIGKHGVNIRKIIHDPILHRMMTERKKGSYQPLFETTDGKLRDYMETKAPGFHPKDFRTHQGTAIAVMEVEKRKVVKTDKEFKQAQKAVATVVAKHLGNTPAVAIKNYIDPAVWGRLRAR